MTHTGSSAYLIRLRKTQRRKADHEKPSRQSHPCESRKWPTKTESQCTKSCYTEERRSTCTGRPHIDSSIVDGAGNSREREKRVEPPSGARSAFFFFSSFQFPSAATPFGARPPSPTTGLGPGRHTLSTTRDIWRRDRKQAERVSLATRKRGELGKKGGRGGVSRKVIQAPDSHRQIRPMR